MVRIAVALVALLHASHCAVAQQKVESAGLSAALKLEEVISGYLTELNGKFKLRLTEVTLAPGAHLGAHHHAGPGMRLVIAGELTFIQAGRSVVYRAGDSFYESGNVVHTAQNNTTAPVRVAFFEVLPVQWSGSSIIPPKTY